MDNNISDTFIVVLNKNKVLEYHRNRPLNDKQIDDLNKTDCKLSLGIQLGDQIIEHPTDSDKAVFMSIRLVEALNEDKDPIVAISCAYLATRFPLLKQLRATNDDHQISVELINDEEFSESTPLKFIDKKDIC